MSDTATTSRETLGFQAEVKQLLHLMILLVQQQGDFPCANWFPMPPTPATSCASRPEQQQQPLRRRFGPENPCPASIRRAHRHHFRQWHRPFPRGSHRPPRHHRQIRHPGVLLVAHRRPGQGRSSDRPVRRRLLLLVHRRRQGDGGSRRAGLPATRPCAGNPAARAISRWNWWIRPAAAPTSPCTCGKAGRFLGGWKLKSIIRKVFRPHHPAHRDEEGRVEGRRAGHPDEDETVNQASATVGAQQERRERRAVQGVLQARRPRFRGSPGVDHARVEGKQEYTQLLYIPPAPLRSLGPQRPATASKLYVRRVFIMDDAEQLMPLSALRARRGRFQRPAPQRLPRILQQSKGHRRHQERLQPQGVVLLEDLAENQPEKFATFWKNSAVC